MLENQVEQINKIKIVYILPTLDPGGAERFIVDLLLNLDLNKFAPTLIIFKRGGIWLQELEKAGIPVIVLKKRFKLDLINFFSILKHLKKIKPLIVHTELGGDLYGRLAAKILRVPFIISTEQNLNPDETIIHNIIKKYTSRLAHKIIAISEAVKNDLIQRYKIPESKIKIIPNGINLNKFLDFPKTADTANPIDNEPKKIILGTIGRLAPQKGHSVLISALAAIKDLNFECLIVGEGPLKNTLNKQIKDLGLENKVKLIGSIQDVPKFLDSLDAFVFPSLWEGQGIVLLEAALMDLPIIASEVDGIKEVLSQKDAYLVKAGDEEDLAAKISWLINNLDSEPVKERSLQLKNKIINKYSITNITNDYQDIYKEVVERQVSRSETKLIT